MRENTAEYFLGLIDNDMYHVKNELDKLIGFVGDREEITKEDVDEIACVQVNGQIFQMMDAVASGDQKRAMKLYRDLLELRESAMSILYLLSRHFNILLQINDLGSGDQREKLHEKLEFRPFLWGDTKVRVVIFRQRSLRKCWNSV